MPNIASVLKSEVLRLARKEARGQVNPTKKTATQLRHDVAELKRQVAQLKRQVAVLSRKALAAAPSKTETETKSHRFSAKGLQAQRSRLDLSASDFGKLVGVSAQSIYSWESEKARPRATQIARLAAMRGLGKREVTARLEQLA